MVIFIILMLYLFQVYRKILDRMKNESLQTNIKSSFSSPTVKYELGYSAFKSENSLLNVLYLYIMYYIYKS